VADERYEPLVISLIVAIDFAKAQENWSVKNITKKQTIG
jgi:hypothetical protein